MKYLITLLMAALSLTTGCASMSIFDRCDNEVRDWKDRASCMDYYRAVSTSRRRAIAAQLTRIGNGMQKASQSYATPMPKTSFCTTQNYGYATAVNCQ